MTIRNAPTKKLQFPIVGIGASAGGLEAFTELLGHMAPDTGMALVLIQHLDPMHESELARIANHPFLHGAPELSPHGVDAGSADHGSPEDDRQTATAHQDDDSPLPSGGSGSPSDGAELVREEARRDAQLADGGLKRI